MPDTQVLTREQLKKITGGVEPGSGSCAFYFPSVSANPIEYGSNTGPVEMNPMTGAVTVYNVSRAYAESKANEFGTGAHWCCDSCSGASWYNPPA